MSILSSAYHSILVAASASVAARETDPMEAAIAALGMTPCDPVDERFMWAYELVEGDERLIVQYRYYDTSGPFSPQPDKNVYLVKLTKAGTELEHKEIRFLDKF